MILDHLFIFVDNDEPLKVLQFSLVLLHAPPVAARKSKELTPSLSLSPSSPLLHGGPTGNERPIQAAQRVYLSSTPFGHGSILCFALVLVLLVLQIGAALFQIALFKTVK